LFNIETVEHIKAKEEKAEKKAKSDVKKEVKSDKPKNIKKDKANKDAKDVPAKVNNMMRIDQMFKKLTN
jgi:hypothetical protein